MTTIIIPQGFAYDIGKNSGPATIDYAEHVLITVPGNVNLATIGIFKQEQQASYNFPPNAPLEGSVDVTEDLVPVASLVLPAGTHVIKKSKHHYVRSADANNIWASPILLNR